MEPRSALHGDLRVGDYTLREKIGQGAFAKVWLAAHHERSNRTVVLKIATNPEFRRQLAREGNLPDLDHPNIVPILNSDTRFAEIPYIVMPYLSGGNLADLIARYPDGLPVVTVPHSGQTSDTFPVRL